jgi:hypothetical protein
MLIDRRSFMQAAALVAVDDFLLPSSNVRAYASSFPASVPTQAAVGGTGTKHVFKVDGWDPREHLPVERSKTLPSYPVVDLAGDEVFIRINQAWRTAWR